MLDPAEGSRLPLGLTHRQCAARPLLRPRGTATWYGQLPAFCDTINAHKCKACAQLTGWALASLLLWYPFQRQRPAGTLLCMATTKKQLQLLAKAKRHLDRAAKLFVKATKLLQAQDEIGKRAHVELQKGIEACKALPPEVQVAMNNAVIKTIASSGIARAAKAGQ